MQTAFTVELGEGADRLEIPWASPDDPANRYADLRAHPEQLGSLAEACSWPVLRDFLRSVNAPESFFATAKCDTWRTGEFTSGERADFPAARAKTASYVDLVFALEAFNFDRRHYEQLARRLAPLLAAEPAAARAELCLRHCYFHARSAWGFYLTVFLYGYGPEPAAAEREWTAGLAALGRALEKLSSVLRQALMQAADEPS